MQTVAMDWVTSFPVTENHWNTAIASISAEISTWQGVYSKQGKGWTYITSIKVEHLDVFALM